MQVIPEDTGWYVLADTMMKLYNAEIQNKAINLHQLNQAIELARQTGDKDWLEKLTGQKITVANQLFQQGPQQNPLMEKFSKLTTVQNNPLAGGPIDQNQVEGNILGPGAEMSPENLDQFVGMKNMGQKDVENTQIAKQQYSSNPRISKQNLTYANAGDAVMQTMNNLYEESKGKDEKEVMRLYDQSVAQLMNIGTIFRRKDIVRALGPIGQYLPAGGGKKGTPYEASLLDAFGGTKIPFSTSISPGDPGWVKAIEAGAREVGIRGFNIKQVAGYKKIGTGPVRTPNQTEIDMARTEVSKQAKTRLESISDTLSPKERLAEAKKIGEELGMLIKPIKGLSGKLTFETAGFDPANPQKLLEAQDSFMRWARNRDIFTGEDLSSPAQNNPVQSNQEPEKKKRPRNAAEYMQ